MLIRIDPHTLINQADVLAVQNLDEEQLGKMKDRSPKPWRARVIRPDGTSFLSLETSAEEAAREFGYLFLLQDRLAVQATLGGVRFTRFDPNEASPTATLPYQTRLHWGASFSKLLLTPLDEIFELARRVTGDLSPVELAPASVRQPRRPQNRSNGLRPAPG